MTNRITKLLDERLESIQWFKEQGLHTTEMEQRKKEVECLKQWLVFKLEKDNDK